MKKILDIIYQGLWTLFLCTTAMLLLSIIIKADKLLYLSENFHADSYDTTLSVKLFVEYGPFQEIPVFSVPYRLFGNFPLLFAFLASLMNIVLNDASLSTALLYLLTEISIAVLLWTKFLKKCNWKVRTLFIALFLANIIFGNLFPLGFRKRQQLSILIGMVLFLAENRFVQGILALAAILAQPFTGAAITSLKTADFIAKKEYFGVALMVAAAALAFPFYLGLFFSTMAEPAMPGCGIVTLELEMLLFFPPLALFYVSNRKKLNALGWMSLALAAFYPLSLFLFILIKDAAPAIIVERFLYITGMPCPSSLFQVAALGMVVLIWQKDVKIPRATIAMFAFISILSMGVVGEALLNESVIATSYESILRLFDTAGMHMIKTQSVVVSGYGGAVQFTPLFPIFPLQGYSILKGKNITFVDEINLPPQASRSGTNIPMARLPENIYNQDLESCRNAIGQMKNASVQGLLFLIKHDFTVPSDFESDRFLERKFLSECGLEIVANTNYTGSMAILYKIH